MRPAMYSYQQKRDFEKFFQADIRRYWNNIMGFDLCEFDDNILKSEDNESISDALLRKYGKEAHDLIYTLSGISGDMS